METKKYIKYTKNIKKEAVLYEFTSDMLPSR